MTKDIINAMYEGKDMGIPANIHDIPFFKEQLLRMNMIPCGYHRYYYREEEMLAHGLKEYNDQMLEQEVSRYSRLNMNYLNYIRIPA